MNSQIIEKDKIYGIIEGFPTAMFVTLRGEDDARARPMHIAHMDRDEGELWFLTGKGGELADEIQKDSLTLLVFQNENTAYLSLYGRSKLTQNATAVGKFWKEPYRVWFPGGPEDPNIALMSFRPVEAEYWDNRGINKLKYIFEAARAYVKGETPDVSDGDQHGKIKL